MTFKYDPGNVLCAECEGTGAGCPHCHLCRGKRSIKIRTAQRNGWKRSDLEGLDADDDYCDCPSCGGAHCDLCQGDGQIPEFEQNQQFGRVLIHAIVNEIPPLYMLNPSVARAIKAGKPNYYPYLVERRDEPRLSHAAAVRAKKLGYINWYADIFGDQISLTEKGREFAAEALRERDSMLATAEGY